MDKQKRKYLEPDDKIITDRYVPRAGDYKTPEEIAKLTPRMVIEQIRALKPYFISQSRANEKAGRPSDDVWHKLLDTGYMYLCVHKNFGGLQASLDEIIEATELLCEADASLGWIAMFLVSTPRQIGGYREDIQRQMYAGNKAPTVTNAIAPFGTAKKVEGGYLLSGRWVWCTTAQFTDWTSLFAQVEDDNGNRSSMRTFLTPSHKMNIVETWEAHGMAGTGTHHMVCDDLFIADAMAGDEVGSAAWGPNDPKLFPNYPIMYAATPPYASVAIATTIVGAANGAVEAARERLMTYNKRGSTIPEREKMSQQMRLSRASVLATAATLLVHQGAKVVIEKLTGPDASQKPEFYEVSAWCAEATELARQVSSMLMQSNGTSVHYLNSPIGRHWRDIFTGSSHGSVDYDPAIQKWGQRMLGIDPKQALAISQHYTVRDELAATRSGDFSRSKGAGDYTDFRAI